MQIYFPARQPCWPTFRDQAINQPSMATWFTHIDSSPANQPVHFSRCKLPLSLNYTLYNPYHCLLHLFTHTTTAAASCVSSLTSPKVDGLHHQRAWISPITTIWLLDTLLLLLASITLLNHWWKNSSSKLHPAHCHYILPHYFGKTSTRWNTVSPMGVRMMTLRRNHIQASPRPFHFLRYLPLYQTASNLYISFTQMDQIHQYWQALRLSFGTVYAPFSPVHLTVTFSNPTLVSNSLSMASNTCPNSPHLSTLLATLSRIAFVTNCPIRIVGMPLMLASWQWHHSASWFSPWLPLPNPWLKVWGFLTQSICSTCSTYPSFCQWGY